MDHFDTKLVITALMKNFSSLTPKFTLFTMKVGFNGLGSTTVHHMTKNSNFAAFLSGNFLPEAQVVLPLHHVWWMDRNQQS